VIVFNAAAVVQAVLAFVPALPFLSMGVIFGSPALFAFGVAVFGGAFSVVDLRWRTRPAEGDGAARLLLPWKGGHVFFVPNWLGGAALGLVCVAASVGTLGYTPEPPAPGEAAFDAADDQLDGNLPGGAVHGDAAALAAAQQFSDRMQLFTTVAIEGGSRDEVQTYVHVSGDTAVFLAKVPGLRKYTSEAKRETNKFAWLAAQRAVEELSPRPTKLVVGVRGFAMYDDVQLGEVVPEGAPTDGVVRHGDRADLYRYFAESPATTTAMAD
jgi:hypothetical protein